MNLKLAFDLTGYLGGIVSLGIFLFLFFYLHKRDQPIIFGILYLALSVLLIVSGILLLTSSKSKCKNPDNAKGVTWTQIVIGALGLFISGKLIIYALTGGKPIGNEGDTLPAMSWINSDSLLDKFFIWVPLFIGICTLLADPSLYKKIMENDKTCSMTTTPSRQ